MLDLATITNAITDEAFVQVSKIEGLKNLAF